jgi:hypothetical protein
MQTHFVFLQFAGRDPPAYHRQAITPLSGAFGERTQQYYVIIAFGLVIGITFSRTFRQMLLLY